MSGFLLSANPVEGAMGSNKRFSGGLHYYHRQGDGRGDGGDKALDWNERKKQMERSRRTGLVLKVGSLLVVLGVVVATFLLMT